jgi:addiction module HigA family antidote
LKGEFQGESRTRCTPEELSDKEYVDPLGKSITDAAEPLGGTRRTFVKLVNGKSGIFPEMSIWLSNAFGGRPKRWLSLQMEYDLALAETHRRPHQGEKDYPSPRHGLAYVLVLQLLMSPG